MHSRIRESAFNEGQPPGERPGLVRVSAAWAPDQYQDVCVAFATAARIPVDLPYSPGQGWRVGICNASGELAAHGTLLSFAQLCSFIMAMENMGGYRPLLFGDTAMQFDCDVVFHHLIGTASRQAPLDKWKVVDPGARGAPCENPACDDTAGRMRLR